MKKTKLQTQIGECVAAGWTIVSETADSVLLKLPRQWDWTSITVGFFLLPIGVGFILIGYALVMRFLAQPKRVYLTTEDVATGNVPDFNEMAMFYYEKRKFWLWLFGLLAAAILFIAVSLLFFGLLSGGA